MKIKTFPNSIHVLYQGAEQIYLIPSTLAQSFETVDIVEETSGQLKIRGKGKTLVTFQCFALTGI